MNEESRKIARVVTKLNIHEQKSDFAYWQSQPYEARLAALEEIRREYNEWRYGAEPGLQRVVHVRHRGLT
jgi:hypothetical protein